MLVHHPRNLTGQAWLDFYNSCRIVLGAYLELVSFHHPASIRTAVTLGICSFYFQLFILVPIKKYYQDTSAGNCKFIIWCQCQVQLLLCLFTFSHVLSPLCEGRFITLVEKICKTNFLLFIFKCYRTFCFPGYPNYKIIITSTFTNRLVMQLYICNEFHRIAIEPVTLINLKLYLECMFHFWSCKTMCIIVSPAILVGIWISYSHLPQLFGCDQALACSSQKQQRYYNERAKWC